MSQSFRIHDFNSATDNAPAVATLVAPASAQVSAPASLEAVVNEQELAALLERVKDERFRLMRSLKSVRARRDAADEQEESQSDRFVSLLQKAQHLEAVVAQRNADMARLQDVIDGRLEQLAKIESRIDAAAGRFARILKQANTAQDQAEAFEQRMAGASEALTQAAGERLQQAVDQINAAQAAAQTAIQQRGQQALDRLTDALDGQRAPDQAEAFGQRVAEASEALSQVAGERLQQIKAAEAAAQTAIQQRGQQALDRLTDALDAQPAPDQAEAFEQRMAEASEALSQVAGERLQQIKAAEAAAQTAIQRRGQQALDRLTDALDAQPAPAPVDLGTFDLTKPAQAAVDQAIAAAQPQMEQQQQHALKAFAAAMNQALAKQTDQATVKLAASGAAHVKAIQQQLAAQAQTQAKTHSQSLSEQLREVLAVALQQADESISSFRERLTTLAEVAPSGTGVPTSSVTEDDLAQLRQQLQAALNDHKQMIGDDMDRITGLIQKLVRKKTTG